MSAVYDKAVHRTFVNSLRSVFLVDDAFPCLGDMLKSEQWLRRFKEPDRAAALYRGFRKRHLPCDIENTFRPGDIKMVERMRKCDLIVLDFHLDADDSDNTKAIEILRRLAASRHFNTVIVYTKADRLSDVWLDIAANLQSDFDVDEFLKEHETEHEWWQTTTEWNKLQVPTEAAMAEFLTGGYEGVSTSAKKAMGDEIVAIGGAGDRRVLVEAWLRHNAAKRQHPPINGLDPIGDHVLQGEFATDSPHWLQCRGCFIAIVKKKHEDEVRYLMSGLDAALLDWKPNFLQILVSEIQNNLELESFAADPRLFSDVERQVGLSHYLLSQLKEDGDQIAAVEAIVDRIVETLRHRISADENLRTFGNKVLTDIRSDLAGAITSDKPIANAGALAHAPGKFNEQRILFLLNSFLSTEHFSKSRITTGTVFTDGTAHWMVTSPACDLTARPTGAKETWSNELHPVKAVFAVKLKLVDVPHSLKDATQGKHAFVVDGKKLVPLEIFSKQTSQPAPEIFFVLDAGRTRFVAGKPATFKAIQVSRSNPRTFPKLAGQRAFSVLGQLRANYASRVLQLTGAHFARIGIDFFKEA
jgi:hypothetical protein